MSLLRRLSELFSAERMSPRPPVPPVPGVHELSRRLPLTERDEEVRNLAAARLLDPDTYGYLLIRLRRPMASVRGEFDIAWYVNQEEWPAFREALERMITAGSEFYE